MTLDLIDGFSKLEAYSEIGKAFVSVKIVGSFNLIGLPVLSTMESVRFFFFYGCR